MAAWSATRMGMVMMPDVSGNQISVTVTMDEGVDKDTAYAKADEVMDRILAVDGVDTVGAMSASSAGGMLGSMGAAVSDDYTDYSYYIMLSDEESSRIDEISQAITDNTRDMGCEVEVSTSGAMDMELHDEQRHGSGPVRQGSGRSSERQRGRDGPAGPGGGL